MAIVPPRIQPPVAVLFGNAVKAVEAQLLPYLKTIDPYIEQIHYVYGHPQEIVNTLLEMNAPQSFQFKKYPLVGLLMDFPEDAGKAVGIRSSVSLRVIIACQTEQFIKAAERYEKNILPILYPIYEALIRQLPLTAGLSGTIAKAPLRIAHTKIDRPFWGREGLYGNEKNIATDCLNCVEIKNLQLNVRPVAPACSVRASNL